jgi:enoyl-CoA hydratase/carnithine racemase
MEFILTSTPAQGVLLVKFNRPKVRNALNRHLLSELGDALRLAEKNPNIKAVVLTGDDTSFSAGADIKEMSDDGIPMWAQSDRLTAWKIIENFSKPLVAAVNGYALGGGCELMLLCDVVILGENARLGFPEVRIAAFPGDGGTQRLPRAIGKTRAMWMIMTGNQIDARKAQSWGLAVDVFPVEETLHEAVKTAAKIAEFSTIAVSMIKAEILDSYSNPLNESLSLERKLLLWQTKDHDEGVLAFAEKRPPNYKDE